MDALKVSIQDMDCIALSILCGPIVAAVVCGLLVITKIRSNTIRHNAKGSSPPSPSFEGSLSSSFEVATLDAATRSNSNCGKRSSTNRKQRRQHNLKKNIAMLGGSKTIHHHMNLSTMNVKNWLHGNVYASNCEKDLIASSCSQDDTSMMLRHIMQHRNNVSTEPGLSQDLNSSSSNEDLSSTYLKKTTHSKQETVSTQKKRKQKRKQYTTTLINTNAQLLNVAEESKEHDVKPSGPKQLSSNAVSSLRKQCTKAAALRAASNDNKMTKMPDHVYGSVRTESNLHVRRSLSAASSTTSINSSISLSASNSPAHSVKSSPTASPTASKFHKECVKRKYTRSPLKQFTKLNMNEHELAKHMKRYVIDPSLLKIYGFPVESVHHEGCVEIYKCLPKHLAEEAVTEDNERHHRHFYGRKKCDVINDFDGLYFSSWSQKSYASSRTDSGHGSGESSPRFTDSDSSEIGDEDPTAPITAFYTPDGVYQIFSNYYNSVEKQCVRCYKMFKVNEKGEYLSFDSCTYHWGKLSNVYDGKFYINVYSCCQGKEFSEGCSQHSLHVWNGSVVGINGPYTRFLHTQPKKSGHRRHPKIYAIDCEMSYTGLGLTVTKVTVVRFDGSLVYEHFVKPQSKIIDYNTRFSGVSEKDFLPNSKRSAKTLEEVQKDLLDLFDADTILVGHGLDNDLKVLSLVHKTIVDTSVIFSHSTGYPYRRSLKNLTKTFLKRDIQCGDMGHSSFEDSRACLELMMWKIRKDLRHWNIQ